jgi:hypothetical protein
MALSVALPGPTVFPKLFNTQSEGADGEATKAFTLIVDPGTIVTMVAVLLEVIVRD